MSDVLVVNNRPSALARWGLDYESVHARAPPARDAPRQRVRRAAARRATGPGFGTLAEAMSGFAHVTGQPDGPPTLPPFFLADGVAAQSATFAVMMALYHRDVHGGGGQLVDVNLIEPLARLIETSTLAYSHLGHRPRPGRATCSPPARRATPTAPPTTGGSPSRARRRTSRCGSTGPSTGPTWPRTPTTPIRSERQARGRRDRRRSSPSWIARAHRWPRSMDVFERAEVAAAPVYDAAQLLADEHLRARGTFVAGRRPGPRDR